MEVALWTSSKTHGSTVHKVNMKTFKNYMNSQNQTPTCNQQTVDPAEENNQYKDSRAVTNWCIHNLTQKLK